ncbi:hypothetical protein P0Y35_02685 [Kiritimatiellaeota bacterium B1221]|nr:hypothetical protein [Kiritimatiellaeota bacterium B1221]
MSEIGVEMNYAAHLSGGKSLTRHVNYAKTPETTWRTPANFNGEASRKSQFGHYDQALKDYKWDGVVLQLFANSLKGDLEAISTFVDLCVENDSCENFYIYSTWPGRPRSREKGVSFITLDFNYSELWEADYTGTADDTSRNAQKNYASHDYVQTLMAELHKKYPEVNFQLIPVGDTLYKIDGMLKAGELPEVMELARRNAEGVPGYRDGDTGAKGVGMFYNDPLHLKKGLGVLISSNTIATVLSGKSPVGLSGDAVNLGGEENEAVVKRMQEIIWEVVTMEPETGMGTKK